MPANVSVERLGIRRVEERNRGSALMVPQEDIQEHPSTHGIRDVGVRRALGEVDELDRAGAVALKLGPLSLGLEVVGSGRAVDGRLHLARHVLVVMIVLFLAINVRPC